MAIQKVSENVLLVDLPHEDSQIAKQLHELNEYINNIGPATSTFGEILRENLQEKLNDK